MVGDTLKRFLLCVAISGALGLVGCATQQERPAGEPSIRGVVTKEAAGGAVLIVWSEDLGVEQAGFDAARVRMRENGRVVKDGATVAFDALQRGDLVDAWFEGPVAESYPVQAGASYIEVIGRYSGELPTPQGLQPPAE